MTTATTSSTAQDNAAAFAAINAKNGTSGSAKSGLSTASEQNDRFLKLLTTQLTNQDPLNPMDNAQMTSQMAQISTVSGLEKLNTAMESLGSQFVQLQAMQGASLVGREVLTDGNALNRDVSGQVRGGIDLSAAASNVKVEVLNASGQMVKTIDLGAQKAGQIQFSKPDDGLLASNSYTFRVVATSGTTAVDASTMALDKVSAVNTSGKTLTLELQHGGTVAYSAVQSIH